MQALQTLGVLCSILVISAVIGCSGSDQPADVLPDLPRRLTRVLDDGSDSTDLRTEPQTECPVSRNAVIECGPDPVCRQSCGTCTAPETCNEQGCVSVCKTVVTESAVLTQFAKSHAARVKLGIVVIRMVSVK